MKIDTRDGPPIVDLDGVRAAIAEIEAQAAALNLNLRELCRLADPDKVAEYNIYRWRAGRVAPTLPLFNSALQALRDALARERARLRACLEGAA